VALNTGLALLILVNLKTPNTIQFITPVPLFCKLIRSPFTEFLESVTVEEPCENTEEMISEDKEERNTPRANATIINVIGDPLRIFIKAKHKLLFIKVID